MTVVFQTNWRLVKYEIWVHSLKYFTFVNIQSLAVACARGPTRFSVPHLQIWAVLFWTPNYSWPCCGFHGSIPFVTSLRICTMIPVWKRHHLIRFLTKVHISTSKMLQEHTHTHTFILLYRFSIQETNTFFQKRPRCLNKKSQCFARVSNFTEVTGKTEGRGAPNFHCFWGEKQRMMGFGVSLPGQLIISLQG